MQRVQLLGKHLKFVQIQAELLDPERVTAQPLSGGSTSSVFVSLVIKKVKKDPQSSNVQ